MADNLYDWLTACITGDEKWCDRHHAEEAVTRNGGLTGRLRREVARNRRVLERHASYSVVDGWPTPSCERCGVGEYYAPWPCEELRDLISIYSDRPGYQTEWGPTNA